MWTIREGRCDEIERLVDLRLAMFDAMGILEDEDKPSVRDDCRAYFAETMPAGAFRVWVAVSSGADETNTGRETGSGHGETRESDLIASIGLVIHSVPPSPHNRVGKAGYIMNLVTLPAWRRRGIARALIEHVLGVLRSEGVPIVGLHASNDGRSLYERLGFRVRDDLPEMRLSLKRDE